MSWFRTIETPSHLDGATTDLHRVIGIFSEHKQKYTYKYIYVNYHTFCDTLFTRRMMSYKKENEQTNKTTKKT